MTTNDTPKTEADGSVERPVRPLVDRLKSHYGHHFTTTRNGIVCGEHHDFTRHPLVGEAITEIERLKARVASAWRAGFDAGAAYGVAEDRYDPQQHPEHERPERPQNPYAA